ncbi:MAG: HlyD family type I secretion periplasmic adaptor subunit [Desulfovibrionales bacterium]|nr:MAG: HlyD family type I secretion periplasmic adaptor subunit [Desulfovibrionales bacterium]
MIRNQNTSSGKASGQSVGHGGRERHLLSQAEQIEETLMPRFIRPMLLLIALILFAFLVWAAVVQLTEVARAPGEIIPIGRSKVVQHLDGGEVSEILMEEGDLVERGQTLLRIDGSQARADLQQMEARWLALTLRAERLLAFAENRQPVFPDPGARVAYPVIDDDPEARIIITTSQHLHLITDQEQIFQQQTAVQESSLAVVASQIDQLRKRNEQNRKSLADAGRHLDIVSELLTKREELAEQRLITRTVLLETRRAKVTAESEVTRLQEEIIVTQEALEEALLRRQDIANQFRRDALTERGLVRAELAEVEEALQRMQARVSRLDVRAPERGLIQDLRVMTTGQVVQPGAVLMHVVPTDAPLEAEVRIQPRDIGHVVPGQPVTIRVSSYDYRRFGSTEGILRRISATNVVTETGEPYFRGWVELIRPYVGDDPQRFQIRPGMSVEAEIITGSKTLLAYLFTPVADIIDRSFGER